MKTLTNVPFKKALVLGLAKSGEAASQLLYDSGIDFRINDQLPLEENEAARRLVENGFDVITGGHPLSVLDGVDQVIKNPGIPYDNPIIQEAEKRNIPVITEVELAYLLVDGPVIAITGSNGKTTTTTLVYELLKAGGKDPLIAGNIGSVASEVLREQKSGQPVIMELSSFQLKGVRNFRPDIGIFLNVTEAHLDYHHTMDDYIQSKSNLFVNQQADDLAIVNAIDPIIRKVKIPGNARQISFSVTESDGAVIQVNDQGVILYDGEKLLHKKDIALPGDHNLENVLASIVVAKEFNIDNEVIATVLRSFIGVKHRLQFVENLNGRRFYNDSKATNIVATTNAIQSFEEPVILIAGGLDRGIEFDELFEVFSNVSYCIAYGESKERIKEAAGRHGYEHIIVVESLMEATEKAYGSSQAGDIILLSPACASWDQFPSFEARGDMFIESVHKLK